MKEKKKTEKKKTDPKMIKIKRKEGTFILRYSNGDIFYKFNGPGPYEIREDHFKHVEDYFEIDTTPEKKKKEVSNDTN